MPRLRVPDNDCRPVGDPVPVTVGPWDARASRVWAAGLLRLPPLPFSDAPIKEQADVLGFVVVSR